LASALFCASALTAGAMLRSTSTPAVEGRLITVSTARVQASAPARSTTRCTCVAYDGFRCCRFALAGYCSLRSCTTLGWCCSLGCCRGPPAGWLHTSGPAPGARVRLSLCCAGWRRSGTLPNVLLNVRSGLPRRSNRLFSRNYLSDGRCRAVATLFSDPWQRR
jgi:hypothetical protein